MEYGLIQTQTAGELGEQDQVLRDEKLKQEEELTISLISHIEKKWTAAKEAKRDIETEMVQLMHQRNGEYDSDKLQEIRSAKQPEIFMNITDTKCRNASAWVKDILFIPSGRIFAVDSTPLPELPPEVEQQIAMQVTNQYIQLAVQQAQLTGIPLQADQLKQMVASKAEEIKKKVMEEMKKKAAEMAEVIADQIDDDFVQGNFYSALEDMIDDVISFPAGFMKGPIFRNVLRKKTKKNEIGQMARDIQPEIIAEYERRSPFSIFPSPRSTDINAGYLFDVIILKPKQLYDLIGTEGYKEEDIRLVLQEFKDGSLKSDWLELSTEAKEGLGEDINSIESNTDENIYCLELWDEIAGSLLLDWGMSEQDITDPDDHYSVCIWKIGKHIIKAMLNYDKMGRKPFYKTSFQVINDSFYGGCVPKKIKDCQQVCNACARSILANVGMGALPQVELNVDRLEPNASRDIIPGRIWPVTEEQMQGGSKALNFYQPTMVTDKLMSTYETFSRIADEHSGVPSWAHGDTQVGGAGNTSSGLAQLIQQAARGIKAVIRNIDTDIIVPVLEYHYDYLMDNEQIYGLAGDYRVSAKGTSALIAKEQMASKKVEYLMQTSNPVDLQIVGMEARRKMLQDVAVSLGIDVQLPEITPEAQMMMQPQRSPMENPQTLDNAGNPSQGVEDRQFNPKRPRKEVSTPGRAGGAG